MMNVLSSQNTIHLPVASETPRPIPMRPSRPSSMESVLHKWVEVPTQALEANAKLLCDADYSDVALVYGGDVFKTHRAVICPRSPIFKAECDGRFSESETRMIQIGAPSATLGAIARMLAFMYGHDYNDRATVTREPGTKGKPAVFFNHAKVAETDPSPEKALKEHAMSLESSFDASVPGNVPGSTDTRMEYFDPSSIPLRDVHVYGVADYYQIPDLQDAAKRKFVEALDSVTDAQELKEIIAQVYEYTFLNDPLRDIVTQHSAAMRHRLNNDVSFLTGVSVIPDFMKDYLIATTQSYENEIVEQMESHMKERDRVSQQYSSEKLRANNLKLQVANNQTVMASLNKRVSGLTRVCNTMNEKHVCPQCQSAHPLQIVKPRVKRPSVPRTDEDAWYLVCGNCSRKVLPKGSDAARAATASPS